MGPVCQIKCDYRFYLEKRALFGQGEDYRMPDEVLAAYTAEYIQSQPTPVVEFVWHGGEPTLRGIDFFRRAVALQQAQGSQKQIRNVLQTNGMLLTDEWCAFFEEHGFFIGEWIARWKGKFDQGWDKVREETLARQIQMGVVPPLRQWVPFIFGS
jgi:uncharacterized protein